MRCPKCDSETPVNEPYCRFCGTELKVTYDQVTESLKKDIKGEKEKDTEAFCRSLLVIVVFALCLTWIFSNLWGIPPKVKLEPVYYPNKIIEVGIYNIHQPHVYWED